MNNGRASKASRSATDPIFKQIITDFFRGWDVDIQTEVEVGRLPRRIDAVVRVAEQALHAIRYLTPFWYFLIHNVIEFKGLADALTIHGYQKILSRCYQYLADHELRTSEIMLTIISARTPRTVLSDPEYSIQTDGRGILFLSRWEIESHPNCD